MATILPVTFRLLGDLAALARPGELDDPSGPLRRRRLLEPAAVKDPLEGLGVPHTEVDLLLLAGRPVGLDELVGGGEEIEVHPVPEAGAAGRDAAASSPAGPAGGAEPAGPAEPIGSAEPAGSAETAAPAGSAGPPAPAFDPDAVPVPWPDRRLQPRPLARRELACDQHLGKLARLLRMLGFDVLWRPDWREADLAAAGAGGRRAILTCNRNLLKRGEVLCGRLVRSRRPDEQAREAIRRFGLPPRQDWFSRCSLCNQPLRPADPREVADRVPPRTRSWRQEYRLCDRCGQVYWEGTHMERLRVRIAAILAGV